MPPISSTGSNRRNEKRFNFFSRIFSSSPPVTSGGRKTAGGASLPLISWPTRTDGAHDSSPGLLHPLSPETAFSLSEAPTLNRIPEVAPQLPALTLGPAFNIDFDTVLGWGKTSAATPKLPSANLEKRFEFKPSGFDTVNSGYTGNYEQHEGFMVLKVIAVVLVSFWVVYAVGWIVSYVRERVRARSGTLPL